MEIAAVAGLVGTLGVSTCAPKPTTAVPASAEAPRAGASESAHLLERARRALIRGDPARALELLREHKRRYPDDWEQHRDGMILTAMCAAGQEAEAIEIVSGRGHSYRRAVDESSGCVSPFAPLVFFDRDLLERTNTTRCAARIEAALEKAMEEREPEPEAEDDEHTSALARSEPVVLSKNDPPGDRDWSGA
jgi:hypothetical protein